jgi:ubiquinone/menaquinone biosynthesis C-methylase UbiE
VDCAFTKEPRLVKGVYSFIEESSLQGENRKYSLLYKRIAWLYHLSGRVFYKIRFGGEKHFRDEFLSELSIKDDDKVLETSAGTGDNFRFLNRKAHYYAVDLSMSMLQRAKAHLRRWKVNATLVHCEAEELPFKDNAFDLVYHCGGINFYNDKAAAIREMIRVAKPGRKLLIVDETERTVQEIYAKGKMTKGLFESGKASVPTELIPKEMLDVRSEVICKGYMYKITFEKPAH